MNKRLILALVLVGALVSLLVAACAAPTPAPTTTPSPAPTATPTPTPTTTPAPAQEVIKWRHTDFGPRGAPKYAAHQRVGQDIMAMSNGRMEIEYFAAGELMPSGEILAATAQGVTNMTHVSAGYVTGVVGQIGELEGGAGCFLDWHQNYILGYELGGIDFLRDVYAEQDLYYLGIEFMSYGDTLYSTVPLSSPDDLENLPVRASGATAAILANLGASTTWYAWEELYTALQMGTVAACEWGPFSLMWGMGLQDICKYWYQPYIAPGAWTGMYINLEDWEALPDDLKLIVEDAFHTNAERAAYGPILEDIQLWPQIDEAVNIVYWSDEDMKKFEVAWKAYMDELGASDEPHCKEFYELIKEGRQYMGEWPE